MTLFGLDVSKWQETTPSLTVRKFLIARATVGFQADTKYAMHIANARKAGLVVGAYHFAYNNLDIDQQAAEFLAIAGDVDLYAVDVEGPYSLNKAQIEQFVRFCRKRGKSCGLYMSESVFHYDADVDWRWVANWSRQPKRYDIWQYRGSPLDLDRFEGTRDELLHLGLPSAPPSDVGEMPIIVGSGRVLGDVAAGVPYYDAPNGIQVGTTGKMQAEWLGSPTLADGTTRDPDWVLIAGLTADLVRVAGIARYIKRADLLNPRAWPAQDCSAAVKAATDPLKAQLAAEMARANAAESRVNNAKTALGCTA